MTKVGDFCIAVDVDDDKVRLTGSNDKESITLPVETIIGSILKSFVPSAGLCINATQIVCFSCFIFLLVTQIHCLTAARDLDTLSR